MVYDTNRASKAANTADFDTSVDKVSSGAEYAKDMLTTCTVPPPNGVGIVDSKVLQATPTEALTSYTDFQINTAINTTWVLALVAMVPCIQVRLLYIIASSHSQLIFSLNLGVL